MLFIQRVKYLVQYCAIYSELSAKALVEDYSKHMKAIPGSTE